MQAGAASDSAEKHAYLFGHSFVSRLSREARTQHRSELDLVGLVGKCKLILGGTFRFNI